MDLVVDDHLLNQTPRIVGDARIIPQKELDLLSRNHIAVVLHIKPRAGRRLPPGGTEARPGHREAHADLDHLLRGGAGGRRCHEQHGGECNV